MINLTILGKFGPYPAINGATSGYLVENKNTTFVMDFGSGVMSRLLEYINPENLDFIILTHTHNDHTCDLGVLSYYLLRKGKRLTVYMPQPKDTDKERFLSYSALDYIYIDESFSLNPYGITIQFYKMRHPVTTYGVKIITDDGVLAYTGDTNTTPNLDNLLKNANCALMDACFLSRDWTDKKPHLNVMQCVELSKAHNCFCILTHLDAGISEDEIDLEARKIYDRYEIAKELKTYRITNEK